MVNRKAHTYKRLLREAQAHVHGLQAENAALRQGVDKVCTEMEASRQEHHHVLAKYEHAMRAIDVGAGAPCLLMSCCASRRRFVCSCWRLHTHTRAPHTHTHAHTQYSDV